MKKSLLALAALSAFAGGALAQSSVTLFGIVDLNGRNVKNGGTDAYSMSTDGNASSRLGFRGVEDLGGGLRAGFWLEAGLGADGGTIGGGNGGANANAGGTVPNAATCTTNLLTGAISCPPTLNTASSASASFFNRRSTVSLLGGFGEIRLGRDYTPTFWNHTVFDVFGTNGVASATNLISVAPTGRRSAPRRPWSVPTTRSATSCPRWAACTARSWWRLASAKFRPTSTWVVASATARAPSTWPSPTA